MFDFDFQTETDGYVVEAALEEAVIQVFPQDDISRIKKGLSLAGQAHKGQYRADGKPYIIHPMRVALLLLRYEPPITADMFIAALLHDALEDSDITVNEIRKLLGEQVAEYTLKLTRYRPDGETPEQRKQGKIRKWEMTMQEFHEIRAIKTFDYLDNMISWKFIRSDQPGFRKIPRWLMEAKTMYLPVAQITNADAFQLMTKEITYYESEGHKTGNWFSDDLYGRLQKAGKFYVDSQFDHKKIGPKTIIINSRQYFRFMDFFYIPQKVEELPPQDVIDLCELRMEHVSKVVDYNLNNNIVRCMTEYFDKHRQKTSQNLVTALDFGCGTGISGELIHQNLNSVELYGVDISRKSVEIACSSGYIRQHIGVDSPLPFSDDRFDVVFAVFVMFFNISIHSLKEIHRVLKDDGYFIFNSYNQDMLRYQTSLKQIHFSTYEEIACALIPSNHKLIACRK